MKRFFYICFQFLFQQVFFLLYNVKLNSYYLDTILEPLSDVIYVCPGMKITFKCNESGIDFLTWTWQYSERKTYDATNYIQNLNKTWVLSSLDGVTTTLTDFRISGSIYIESTLQFTPSGNFISANVSCNTERRVVKITGINKKSFCCLVLIGL